MKPYNTPNIGSYKAGADLSAKQYCFVKAGTNEQEVVAYNGSGKPLGILMNAPASGEAAEVALPGGGAKVKLAASSGTPAAGAMLATDSSGNGIAAVNIDDLICAQVDSIGSAAANSDIVPVIVLNPTVQNLITATVGAMTAKNPETDVEAGFLTISKGGTQYEVPFYAKV